jgi:hypothetical protein
LREQTHNKCPQIYVKLGTTGLGGMGLNLPYTHEQYTSEFMVRKAALSGAQTALLLAYGYLGPLDISKKIFEVALIIKSTEIGKLSRASAREILNNVITFLKSNKRVVREIAALNLSIRLPKGVNYSEGVKHFEPGEGNQTSIDLGHKNIKAWTKIIRMYLQQHPSISDKELSAGEIVGLYFKLQDRRRLDEKD